MDSEEIEGKLGELVDTVGYSGLGDTIHEILVKILKESQKQSSLLDDIESRLRNIESNTDRIE